MARQGRPSARRQRVLRSVRASTWAPPSIQALDRTVVIMLLLAIMGSVIIYSRSIRYDFTDWDDPRYIVDNAELKAISWQQVEVEFNRRVMGNYHPITMLSYALDIAIGGREPWIFHLTSVLLHLMNVILVFIFLWRLSGDPWPSAAVALLVSVHPMHVEAIAWVSDRKDVLQLLFTLIGLIAYVSYLRSMQWGWLVVAFVLFCIACLSKATAVAMVPLMVLIDIFWERRLSRVRPWLEKLPFIAMAIIVGLVAIEAQRDAQALAHAPVLEPWQRAVVVVGSIGVYVIHQIIPLGSCAVYYYGRGWADVPWFYPLAAALVPILAYLIHRHRQHRQLWFGALFFLASIALVLQFQPVGQALRADRYTYQSGIGWGLMLVWLFRAAAGRWMPDRWNGATVVTIVYALFLGLLAYQRLPVWSSALTLWDDIIRGNPEAAVFYSDRGATWQKLGKFDRAIAEQDKALAIYPHLEIGLFNRGMAWRDSGRYEEAMRDLLTAFQGGSKRPELLPSMIYCLLKMGKCKDVVTNCTAALVNDPRSADLLNMRAWCLLHEGELKAAVKDIDRSLSLRQDIGSSWYLRGKISLALGDTARACLALERSLGLEITDPDMDTDRRTLLEIHCRD